MARLTTTSTIAAHWLEQARRYDNEALLCADAEERQKWTGRADAARAQAKIYSSPAPSEAESAANSF